jgi:hypothetical protein
VALVTSTRAAPTAAACAALAACSLDLAGKDACELASDCLDGLVCVERTCVAAGSVPGADAAPDAPLAASGPGFRIAEVRLPLTDDERVGLGLDLDGDPARSIDNRWHAPLHVASDLGWYSQGALDEHLTDGRLAIHGELTGDGEATLRLRDGATLLGELTGTRRDGRLTLGPGTLTVPLTLLTGLPSPATMELVAARVEIADAASGPGGWREARLGGGIRLEALRTALPTALAEVVHDVVAIDCPGAAPACCRDGSSGQRLVRDLDRDGDCAITAAEIAAHPALAALAPDIDLVGADCISVGIGFATAPATVP